MTKLLPPVHQEYVAATIDNLRQSLKLPRAVPPENMGVLLSIHLQSNRPENFTQFLDDLEASIDDPANVEVVVKIDDVDIPMNALLPIEAARRPFKVKYISTPLDGGFFELWRSMNDILEVSDPNAYFLWNMNDEMAVLNKGWDSALRQYVGLFPDHIFRLRTSLFRARNYCDFWENGFAPETSAITTRRWIEIGGDWNPCLGPDSFQQCVAYYFSYHERHNKYKPLREVPIHIMTFKGEGAFLGLQGEKLWKRMRGATRAWYRLMSHSIQQEASKRAQKLHAHICAYNNDLDNFKVHDDTKHKTIQLLDLDSKQLVRAFPYRLSWMRISLTNFIRCPHYLYYAGGGYRAKYPFIIGLTKFLALRFNSFEWIYHFSKWYSDKQPKIVHYMVELFIQLTLSVGRIRDKCAQAFHTAGKKLPTPLRQTFKHAFTVIRPVLGAISRAIRRSVLSVVTSVNRGYPPQVLLSHYRTIANEIDWQKVDAPMGYIVFPERYINNRYRRAVLRCIILQHWYGVEPEGLLALAEQKPDMRHFLGMQRYKPLPTAKAVRHFRNLLIEEGVLDEILEIASDMAPLDLLPPLTEPEKQNNARAAA